MTLIIRPGEPADLEALVQCTVGVARESEGRELDEDIVRGAIASALEDPNKARYVVAEETGDEEPRIVGSLYVTYEWSDWTGGWYWWIQAAYVVPDERGRGIYREMVAAVREAAEAQGDVRQIRLYVDDTNEVGLAAHEAVGFLPTEYVVMEIPVNE